MQLVLLQVTELVWLLWCITCTQYLPLQHIKIGCSRCDSRLGGGADVKGAFSFVTSPLPDVVYY